MHRNNQGLASLSFARARGGGRGICLWIGHEPDDAVSDSAEGRRRAIELLDLMQQGDLPFLLGHVIEAIAAQGHIGPMERAFIHHFAEAALCGHYPVVQQPQPQCHLRLVNNT